MVNRHMSRYSTSLVSREMLIKTTVKYHYTTIGMTRLTLPRAGENAEQLDVSYSGDNKANMVNHLKQLKVS